MVTLYFIIAMACGHGSCQDYIMNANEPLTSYAECMHDIRELAMDPSRIDRRHVREYRCEARTVSF